jgi:hypothetical protein
VKASRNYWVDIALALLSLVLLVSSVMLWVIVPQGYLRSRLLWLEVHKWSGLAVTLAVIVHLTLHWRWLVSMTKRRLGVSGRQHEHEHVIAPRQADTTPGT